jgi:hypothetical protein
MKAKEPIGKAGYFGVEVESLVRLNHCALVRYQGKKFVVDAADLTSRRTFAKAA